MAKILVVDDEPAIRFLFRSELEEEGHEVIEASSGEEALDIISSGEPIDLMILDIRMGEMSGLEVLQRVVKEERHIPVILCSAYASYQDDFTSWLADSYVVKSPDLTELKNEVKRLLEKYKKE